MTFPALLSILLIAFALVMFIWGRLRYDVVSLLCLLIGVIIGIIPERAAFNGFGHPAVVTVMAVLIISKALDNSGIISVLAATVKPFKRHISLQVFVMTLVVAVLSSFMNNVGALAVMLPVAMQQASVTQRSPSYFMMPLAFGSLLGGLTTLIGTPPNIIIANIRAEKLGEPFAMFDFAPVGIGVALAGIVFMALIGWRLLPARKDPSAADANLFELKGYITEAHVPETSRLVGRLVREFEGSVKPGITVAALIRKDRKILAPSGFVPIQENDILLVEGDPAALIPLLDTEDLRLEDQGNTRDMPDRESIEVLEAVVPPGARLEGGTVRGLRLRVRYGINLLAIALQGRSQVDRLGSLRLAAGDVLLLQGERTALKEAISGLGCLPLATRNLNLDKRKTIVPFLIFASAIALSVMGVLPIHISFTVAVLLIIIGGFLSVRDIYESIDWPVIVLLGGMIPVGQALKDTGATEAIAGVILGTAGMLSPVGILVALMVVTMFLSDVVNNAVTAVVMAPIAIGLAEGLGVNPDSFLLGVAITSSSAFLTPIGHQSNTLVMAPGGYKFSDYTRMGLPLEILILAVSVPLILYFWPLYPPL